MSQILNVRQKKSGWLYRLLNDAIMISHLIIDLLIPIEEI